MSLLGSWSLAATFLADVNHSGSQEDLVSNWEPACSFAENSVAGAKTALFQLWLSPAGLYTSGKGWAGRPASSPLVFAQFFVL